MTAATDPELFAVCRIPDEEMRSWGWAVSPGGEWNRGQAPWYSDYEEAE